MRGPEGVVAGGIRRGGERLDDTALDDANLQQHLGVEHLVTALGVGLASSIRGRNPMTDGFGLIAFASLTPMIFVMGYGMLF